VCPYTGCLLSLKFRVTWKTNITIFISRGLEGPILTTVAAPGLAVSKLSEGPLLAGRRRGQVTRPLKVKACNL
jgi:hypothetical protein